jgi:UDP-N-acetylglucosamine 2-epimerase (non-hydrolysing)
MKKIMLTFGTRPEAIKMAPLVKALQARPDEFKTIVAVTGQHRQMLDQVLNLFEITPDYDLNIMQQGQDLFDVTSRILLGMRDILKEAQPDLVLVHGDTATSTAAALSAYYLQIPVGHVEAGLRTGNIYSPFPEEMNRQLTGRIATLHFSPTDCARQNLLRENVSDDAITVTGNTVIDALHTVVEKIDTDSALEDSIKATIAEMGYDMSRLDSGSRRLVVITGHRRENFGEGFHNICLALKELSERYPEVDFVYPMHLNPNVRRPIAETFGNITHSNFFFIEPAEYLPFVYLMKRSYLIITDSGGIQEEAPSLGKPVLVMREVTERPEALEAGTIRLVGTDRAKIVGEASHFLDDQEYYEANRRIANPYGDGTACKRIIEFIENKLG